MKKTKLMKPAILLMTALFIWSCSSDDDSSNNSSSDPNNPTNENYLSTIDYIDYNYEGILNKDTLAYSNGKLVKAYFASCNGRMYQFEYGGNGKVSKVYESDIIVRADSESYGENEAYDEDSEIHQREFEIFSNLDSGTVPPDYFNSSIHTYNSNNQLEEIKQGSGEMVFTTKFEYDEQDRLFKVSSGFLDDLAYTEVTQFDSNNNPKIIENTGDEDVVIINYEYDSKLNPFYSIFTEYGLIGLECNFDVPTIPSPNNVTIESNGSDCEIQYSYKYDGNYPISRILDGCNGTYEVELNYQ